MLQDGSDDEGGKDEPARSAPDGKGSAEPPAKDVDVSRRPRQAGGLGKTLGVVATLVVCAVAGVFVWHA